MEERLVRPSLDGYRKRDYIKKYWWLLLIALTFTVIGFFVNVEYFYSSILLMFLFSFIFNLPLIGSFMLYYVLYEKDRAKKWKEYERWENEPEVKEARMKAYNDHNNHLAIGDIVKGIKILKKLYKEKTSYVLEDVDGENYVVCKVEDPESKTIIIEDSVFFTIKQKT
jgi:hypothetical protein